MHFDVADPFVEASRLASHKRFLKLPGRISEAWPVLLDRNLVLDCGSCWPP